MMRLLNAIFLLFSFLICGEFNVASDRVDCCEYDLETAGTASVCFGAVCSCSEVLFITGLTRKLMDLQWLMV